MNAGIVLSFHGSFEGIFRKCSGNTSQVSEMLLIREYCSTFDKVIIFSHDSRSYENMLPKNCRHVRLRNRLFYIFLGWLVVLFYTWRNKLKIIRVVGAAGLPLIFMLNRLTGSKVIIMYYYLWWKSSTGLKRGLIRPIERFLVKFVDYVIAGNLEVKEFSGNKTLDINEGIITEIIDNAKPSQFMKRLKGTKVIFVGRLVDIKDPITVIRAHRMCLEKFPNLHLVVCGDGPLMEQCRKEAGKNVHFLGFSGKVPELLKGADIFAITSKYDASPRALMEAMAAGLPSVATNVGGVPEYLTSQCGIIVPPGEPSRVADAIISMIKDRQRASSMGRNARTRARTLYSLKRNIEKEIAFLKNNLGCGKHDR